MTTPLCPACGTGLYLPLQPRPAFCPACGHDTACSGCGACQQCPACGEDRHAGQCRPSTEIKYKTSSQVFLENLERYMQIAEDTRKRFHYLKTPGKWVWVQRDALWDPAEQHKFDTYWHALCDAVEPYVGEDSREKEE